MEEMMGGIFAAVCLAWVVFFVLRSLRRTWVDLSVVIDGRRAARISHGLGPLTTPEDLYFADDKVYVLLKGQLQHRFGFDDVRLLERDDLRVNQADIWRLHIGGRVYIFSPAAWGRNKGFLDFYHALKRAKPEAVKSKLPWMMR